MDGTTKFKARFGISSQLGKFKKLMVHSCQTLQPISVGFLLSLAATHRFAFWTSEFKQTYLQSEDPFGVAVYVRDPPAEFKNIGDSVCSYAGRGFERMIHWARGHPIGPSEGSGRGLG